MNNMELTQEQSDMVELLGDLGMTMEAIEFEEESLKSSAKRLKNKASNAYWDRIDPMNDTLDRIPGRKAMLHSKYNPFHEYNDQYYKDKAKRDAKRKKKQAKESFDDLDIDMELLYI